MYSYATYGLRVRSDLLLLGLPACDPWANRTCLFAWTKSSDGLARISPKKAAFTLPMTRLIYSGKEMGVPGAGGRRSLLIPRPSGRAGVRARYSGGSSGILLHQRGY